MANRHRLPPQKTDSDDDRFTTVNVPITSIAVSTGQNDAGVFELNFRDERYLPFEGAGAISKWRARTARPNSGNSTTTPSPTSIMQLRYTAIDGGDKLGRDRRRNRCSPPSRPSRTSAATEGLFAAFDVRHEFPDEWYKATHNTPSGAHPGQPGTAAAVLHTRTRRQNPGHRHLPLHQRPPAPAGVTPPREATTPRWAPGPPVGTTLATFDATELSGGADGHLATAARRRQPIPRHAVAARCATPSADGIDQRTRDNNHESAAS